MPSISIEKLYPVATWFERADAATFRTCEVHNHGVGPVKKKSPRPSKAPKKQREDTHASMEERTNCGPIRCD